MWCMSCHKAVKVDPNWEYCPCGFKAIERPKLSKWPHCCWPPNSKNDTNFFDMCCIPEDFDRRPTLYEDCTKCNPKNMGTGL